MSSKTYILQESAMLPDSKAYTDADVMECPHYNHAVLWISYRRADGRGMAEVLIEVNNDLDGDWYAPALYIPAVDGASEITADTLLIAPPMGQEEIRVSYHVGLHRATPYLRVRCREVGDIEKPGTIEIEGTFS